MCNHLKSRPYSALHCNNAQLVDIWSYLFALFSQVISALNEGSHGGGRGGRGCKTCNNMQPTVTTLCVFPDWQTAALYFSQATCVIIKSYSLKYKTLCPPRAAAPSCRCCGQRSLPQSPHPNSTPLRFGICHGSWVQQCNEKDLFIKTSRTGTRHAGFKCKSHRNRAAPCGCVHFPRMLSTVSPSWGADVLCYKVGTKFVWSRGCFYKDPPVEGVYSPLSFFNLYFEACIIPSSPVSGSYQAWAHFYEPVYFSCQSCEGQRASPAL